MPNKMISTIIVSSVVLAGCETLDTNRLLGTGLGAAAGGGLCKLTSANDTECAILLAGGAVAGYALTDFIDKQDQEAYQQATDAVLMDGKPSATVISEKTGTPVTVSRVETSTPAVSDSSTYKAANAMECQTMTVFYEGEKRENKYCKDSNGQWAPTEA